MNGLARERLEHFRWMVLGRVMDERLASLYRSNQIRGGSVFLGKGQEAFSAAGAMALRRGTAEFRGDIFAPLIRDTAGRQAFGEPLIDGARTNLGRSTGPMRGREGNVHRGNLAIGQLPMISHLGSTVAPVCGMLMARRHLGTLGDSVGMVSIGDGAMQTGAAHEGLNAAAVEKLPLVILLANNQVSYSTFSDRSYACKELVDRAHGYGIAGTSCDGTDFDACRITVQAAVAAARAGGGPQLIEATLLRLAGHGQHDDNSYMPEELFARFGDCVPLAEARLIAEGVLDAASAAAVWDDCRAQVVAAVDQALTEPEPDPAVEDWSARSIRDLTGFKP